MFMGKITKDRIIEELATNNLSYEALETSNRLVGVLVYLNKAQDIKSKLYKDELEALAKSVEVLLKINRLCD